MTATVVEWVLDELGAVVDAQPDAHPLRRVDRDNSLLYDGGGTFDMSAAMDKRSDGFQKANYVGASFADRDREYIGSEPNLDVESVVGVRIEGYSGSFGHVDPTGQDGVVFHGTDEALVEQIQSTLYDALKYPDAGRTNVSFTHLSITNESPALTGWQEYHRYDFDVVFDGYEDLS
ncbi:hypothetical protein [Halorussus marinus]|uniref:hypothetical protein n=1 Tax=Halorussus marinus TaxID=2505976 RepID=UPI0010924BF6|nr:hypothetical protein [Halorussus marinus]